MSAAERPPSLGQALLPLALLVALLVASVNLFGEDASAGPNQIALLLAAASALAIGRANGLPWDSLQQAVVQAIAVSGTAIFILLLVGAVIGARILSGTVPTLIDYGLASMSPRWFLPTACAVSALAGLAIGSSWTVAGTLGVALMGVALGLGVNPAAAAGAIVSGAYFGDKLSPLSDTTNLAPAAAGTELFAHIRFMSRTSIPAFALALVGFTVLGWGAPEGAVDTSGVRARLAERFALGPHLLAPLALVLVLAARRVPALPTLGAGAALACVLALVFQPERVAENAGLAGGALAQQAAGVWRALAEGVQLQSGDETVDRLLNRGGMASMLTTVWLILCALAFGAALERAGLLARLLAATLTGVRRGGTLVLVTVLTALGLNLITSDQYIAIVLSGRLYRLEFDRLGLDRLHLSRAVEDGGTLTSALIPWNTCGATMAATLGVSTLSFAPYALFNWLGPLLAIALALLVGPRGPAGRTSGTGRPLPVEAGRGAA